MTLASQSAPTAARARVLAVDDDADALDLIRLALEEQGFFVTTAESGVRGLAEAIARPPDLIVCDVNMPGVDGWCFLKLIRARPDLALVPVLLLTAITGDQARLKSFQLGADDMLSKPFRLSDLATRAAGCLARSARIAAAARSSAAPGAAPALSGSLEVLGLGALLDLLSSGLASGRVRVTGPSHAGTATLSAGQVVDARIDEMPMRSVQEALRSMLAWERGSFEFSPASAP